MLSQYIMVSLFLPPPRRVTSDVINEDILTSKMIDKSDDDNCLKNQLHRKQGWILGYLNRVLVGRGIDKNKAGYKAIQSRTVGQGWLFKNRPKFQNVTDGRTDQPTDTARCRVAYPRLKTNHAFG